MKPAIAYLAGIYTWYVFGPRIAKRLFRTPLGVRALQSFSPDEFNNLYQHVQNENRRRNAL